MDKINIADELKTLHELHWTTIKRLQTELASRDNELKQIRKRLDLIERK
jgi:hypothetical protein